MLSHRKTYSFVLNMLNISLLTTFFLSAIAHSKTAKNSNFIESEIISPFNLTHPVMAINLLTNKGKELVTFSVDETDNRWLIIYALNQQTIYTEVYRTSLPADFYSFDISMDKGDQLQALYFLSSSQLFILQEEQITAKIPFKAIYAVSSMAVGKNEQYLAQDDFLVHLNNDEYEDVYIADFQHGHVLIQTEQGFQTSSLPISPETVFTPEVMKYFKNKTYFGDVNFDQLKDVIYIDDGKIVYFLQQNNSTIDPTPHYLPINKLISGLDWWNKLGIDGEKLDQSNLSYRKIEQLKDINYDGIVDMVVQFSQSEGVLNKTNDYEIYLGRNRNNILEFLDQPDSKIQAEGTLTNMQFVDIDNDNKDEILVAGFDIGVSQIIGALISGSIDQDIHIFYMDENSHFNKKSKVTKEVELSFSLSSGSQGKPVVLLLDVNGDKRQDIMLSADDEMLKTYFGTPDKRMFARKPEKHKIQLPKQGDMITSSDINNDGKADLLIKYGREDEEALRKTFKLLMSQ